MHSPRNLNFPWDLMFLYPIFWIWFFISLSDLFGESNASKTLAPLVSMLLLQPWCRPTICMHWWHPLVGWQHAYIFSPHSLHWWTLTSLGLHWHKPMWCRSLHWVKHGWAEIENLRISGTSCSNTFVSKIVINWTQSANHINNPC
jgi:hypothetical protein